MSFLYDHQMKAVKKMHNGCILCGGVGSGKSRTSLYYYFSQCGGEIDDDHYKKMEHPVDLYIITTAKKRDNCEWDVELSPYLLSRNKDLMPYDISVVVDSWNNIKKYAKVKGSFFIFDEQRVVGNGVWVQSFIKISRENRWILLSATPGDTWMDYVPVFIANGFYKSRTQFEYEHVVFNRFCKYKKVDRYLNTGRLIRLRNKILVDMPYEKYTKTHHEMVLCDYDISAYKKAGKLRWDPFKEEPIRDAGSLCYVWRRIANSDPSRAKNVERLVRKHSKVIIFYNFDYERDILLDIDYGEGFKISEWSGHAHQEIPFGNKWVYLVQYTAGCEGWNCIKTDTIIFYSQNYSYKVVEQACGRIDRINTPFNDLYYYHLTSKSGIDMAISLSLRQKKKFNEGRFVKW